jgi:hypothetical protein
MEFGLELAHRVQSFTTSLMWHLKKATGNQYPTIKNMTTNTVKRNTSQSLASRLVAIGQKHAELFHSPEGVAYADVVLGGAGAVYCVNSKQFSKWLKFTLRMETGEKCDSRSMQQAIDQLSAIAKFSRTECPVFSRVGKIGDSYYLDLGTPDRKVVKYSAAGWKIKDFHTVRFERSPRNSPLPLPVAGGELEELFSIMETKDEDIPYLTDFLVKCLLPSEVEPLLMLCGGGAALAAESLKLLVDPFTVNRLPHVLGSRKLVAYAQTARLLLYESFNFESQLSEDIDRIVHLSRGDSQSGGLCRPQLMVFPCQVKADFKALGRSTVIEHPYFLRVGQVSEKDYWGLLQHLRPELLGALLCVVCQSLAVPTDCS